MSYILDALRRAEAERGRGAVPGVHSQAVPVSGRHSTAGRPVAVVLWIAAGVACVALLAAAGTWWMVQRSAPHGEEGAVAAPSALSGTPLSPFPPAPGPAPTLLPAAAAVAATAPAQPGVPALPAKRTAPSPRDKAAQALDNSAVPPPPSMSSRARAVEATRIPETAPERGPVDAVRRPVPPAAAVAPAVVALSVPTEPATGAVFTPADLPDAVRAQLPALKISGITYSRNPVSRMAIVNGQVLHEGEPVAPGLVLERIEPESTVWSFRGYRYGLTP